MDRNMDAQNKAEARIAARRQVVMERERQQRQRQADHEAKQAARLRRQQQSYSTRQTLYATRQEENRREGLKSSMKAQQVRCCAA